jgi:uncharacterized membrane protein HdeD (DUF308 family)
VLSVIFGILVFAQPDIGITTLMWIMATFAFLVGVLLILLSLKLHKAGDQIGEKAAQIKEDLKNQE